jgi:hypothetical protein
MRVVRTLRGARLVQGGLVLSEVLRHALAPGPRVLLLGFAGGSVVAPLRAMGFAHALQAVDLDLRGASVFRDLSRGWGGVVDVRRGDAVLHLRRTRRPWDAILEDLSVEGPHGVVNPGICLGVLPPLLARAVGSRGVAVVNLLPAPGTPWKDVLRAAAAPWRRALVVHLDEYENRVLLVGAVPDARTASRLLREPLRAIGSRQAERFAVRTLRT